MERLFDLDFQLLHDAVITAVAVFVLFLFMSYMLFKPTRELLRKRQERIEADLDSARSDKDDAEALKNEYEAKMANAQKDADAVLAEARQKAVKNEEMIISQAKDEAAGIIRQAHNEAELEKRKAADEVKTQIIDVASLLAGKVVAAGIDTKIQDSLIEETLKEVGESTWQS
ncbi:MAG: F0F1 ATP synthase subunit B [Lachnospiraceae bacterium]|nr:F0F1 ATP synthase subunit B [Lachnospiraceae bacterium]MBO4904202.1 F0F1 ATP synthase subunit B [Lachnospiraceae bacterium]